MSNWNPKYQAKQRKEPARQKLPLLAKKGPLAWDPDWLAKQTPVQQRLHVAECFEAIQTHYPNADETILSRVLWVAKVMEAQEKVLAKCLSYKSAAWVNRLQANTALYNDLAKAMVELLKTAERQQARWEAKNAPRLEIEAQPWRGRVEIPA